MPSVSLTTIDEWFKTLRRFEKIKYILKKLEQIFNMDKSGFAGEAGRRVVVVKYATKYANQQVNSIHYAEVIHVDLVF